MSTSKLSLVKPWIIALVPVMMLMTADLAGAAGTGTGIAQLDTAKAVLIQFVQGLAIFACIFLLGILVWDFVQHRNISRSIFEFLGVIILGVIALNASAVAGVFQGAGAGL